MEVLPPEAADALMPLNAVRPASVESQDVLLPLDAEEILADDDNMRRPADIDQDENMGMDGDESGPLCIRLSVKEPSRKERELHVASGHVPYRSWCRACIAGKGRQDPHKCDNVKRPHCLRSTMDTWNRKLRLMSLRPQHLLSLLAGVLP
eukprot:1597769-Amphidinium_carterae.1